MRTKNAPWGAGRKETDYDTKNQSYLFYSIIQGQMRHIKYAETCQDATFRDTKCIVK